MHNLIIALLLCITLLLPGDAQGNVGRGVPPRPPKPSDSVIGLPVKATPSQELPSIYIGKKTKWRTKLPQGFACASLPFNKADFCREGTSHFRSSGSRFQRKQKYYVELLAVEYIYAE